MPAATTTRHWSADNLKGKPGQHHERGGITAFKYPKGDCREDGDGLFSWSQGTRLGATASRCHREN